MVSGAEASGQFIAAATFVFPGEALVARGLLEASGITCYLENDHVLAMVWAWNYALGGVRLMVPASRAEDANELLNPSESFGELVAEHTSGPRFGFLARLLLAFFILMTPNSPDYLRLIYVFSR